MPRPNGPHCSILTPRDSLFSHRRPLFMRQTTVVFPTDGPQKRACVWSICRKGRRVEKKNGAPRILTPRTRCELTLLQSTPPPAFRRKASQVFFFGALLAVIIHCEELKCGAKEVCRVKFKATPSGPYQSSSMSPREEIQIFPSAFRYHCVAREVRWPFRSLINLKFRRFFISSCHPGMHKSLDV